MYGDVGSSSTSGMPGDGQVFYSGTVQAWADPKDTPAQGQPGRPLPVDHPVDALPRAPDPSAIQMPAFKPRRKSQRTISERHEALRVNTSRHSSSSDPTFWTEPSYISHAGLLSTKIHHEDQSSSIYVEAGSRQQMPQEFSYFSSGEDMWAGGSPHRRYTHSGVHSPVLGDPTPLHQPAPMPGLASLPGEGLHSSVSLLGDTAPVHHPASLLADSAVLHPPPEIMVYPPGETVPLLANRLDDNMVLQNEKRRISNVSTLSTPSTQSELTSPGSRRPSGALSFNTSSRPSSDHIFQSLRGPAPEALQVALEKGATSGSGLHPAVRSTTLRELLSFQEQGPGSPLASRRNSESSRRTSGISGPLFGSSSPAIQEMAADAVVTAKLAWPDWQATSSETAAASSEAAPTLTTSPGEAAGSPPTPAEVVATDVMDGDGLSDVDESQFTTTMLHNLPSDYSRDRLAKQLDESGFNTKYDFLYLPVDFRKKRCFGYAFINFVTHEDALAFREMYAGFQDWDVPSDKGPAHVTWSSAHQGLEGHVNRYRNSPVMHESVLDEFKPILLKDGVRISFPPPLTTIRKPRIRELRHGSRSSSK